MSGRASVPSMTSAGSPGSAFATIYPKAIYLVESEPYEVQELHFREDEEKVAYVKRVAVDYFTDAISAKGVWILQRLAEAPPAPYLAEQGMTPEEYVESETKDVRAQGAIGSIALALVYGATVARGGRARIEQLAKKKSRAESQAGATNA